LLPVSAVTFVMRPRQRKVSAVCIRVVRMRVHSTRTQSRDVAPISIA
jgi:hypothetical protein